MLFNLKIQFKAYSWQTTFLATFQPEKNKWSWLKKEALTLALVDLVASAREQEASIFQLCFCYYVHNRAKAFMNSHFMILPLLLESLVGSTQRDSRIRDARIIVYDNRLHFLTQIAIFRPFLAIVLPNTWIFSTKLWFRLSFWGAEQVWILIGSKVMIQNAKTQMILFTKSQKTRNGNVCILYHNFWTN